MFYTKLFRRGGKVKPAKRGKTVKAVDYQTTPFSDWRKGDKKMDKKRSALKPGRRISKRGKKYTETRANRSDLSKKTGL